jgi:hypothetical protein
MRVQNAVWPCGHFHPDVHPGMHGRSLGFPPPPGVCCQATADGGKICSDGTGYPPG